MEQSGTDGFARVDRDDGRAPVFVLQEMMAAFAADLSKTQLGESRYELRAGQSRRTTHAAMVMR